MFARENESANIAILLRNDATLVRVLSVPSARSTHLPRAVLEIEINSSLPGVHVTCSAAVN